MLQPNLVVYQSSGARVSVTWCFLDVLSPTLVGRERFGAGGVVLLTPPQNGGKGAKNRVSKHILVS